MARKIKLYLPDVTLVSVTGIDPKRNLRALEISMNGIDFGASLLLSRQSPSDTPTGISVRKIRQPEWNYNHYSKFVLFDLVNFINTEYALIVHHRAHVLRPDSWSSRFLDFDYIGAPWRPNTHFTSTGLEVRVGNGGFSLRSQKLLRAPSALELPFTDNGTGFYHEDGVLCVYHRERLEEYGIKFAPTELAAAFSTEASLSDAHPAPFGFHNTKRAIPRFFFLKYQIQKLVSR